jgi:hypothetical protein
MLKLTYRYDQSAVRLVVEGLPDFSAGQSHGVIGILSSWRLQLLGAPELEGKREHLEALMQVMTTYCRHQLSGVARPFGTERDPVNIGPGARGHQLLLRSSQPDVEPLTITLDDAELADLMRCLDALRLDPKVQVSWPMPTLHPLPRRELAESIPVGRRFGAPVLGASALALVAVLSVMVPVQPPANQPTAEQAVKDALTNAP